jgi:hypothetical protein
MRDDEVIVGVRGLEQRAAIEAKYFDHLSLQVDDGRIHLICRDVGESLRQVADELVESLVHQRDLVMVFGGPTQLGCFEIGVPIWGNRF